MTYRMILNMQSLKSRRELESSTTGYLDTVFDTTNEFEMDEMNVEDEDSLS
ncbi:hypothetical protein H0H81_012678 [Sphagnurus paluster]|uniref:Uncharacterized protein n=1 Tax=Sphagnurus paluster TaxID=117069 RepID=A0A9P7K3K9_9AGAR|nr:hypothetical protein H0H81_012678 [Sphagnurus paluster]